MAGLTTLSEMPSAIYAGDTLLLSLNLGGYSADEWSCAFSFRFLSGSEINISATADGANHAIDVGASETGDWVPGIYTGVGKVTNIADETRVATFWTGELVVRPNLAISPGDTDTRSWAKKCLDTIEAVIQGKASKDVINSTIAGQSIGRMTPEQLFMLRDRFKAEYLAEQDEIEAAQGKGQRSNICITFINP